MGQGCHRRQAIFNEPDPVTFLQLLLKKSVTGKAKSVLGGWLGKK